MTTKPLIELAPAIAILHQMGLFQAAWEISALPTVQPDPLGAQCCMCGKTGLSTAEGDGGSECELPDGRWTCCHDCYDLAVADDDALDRAALARPKVRALVEALEKREKAKNSDDWQDFIDADDAVEAALAALTKGAK